MAGQAATAETICKLEGNLVCLASTKEISMVDLRMHEQKLWSAELEGDNAGYLLTKIYFDEFKCIAGMSGNLRFFDTQNGKLLYTKGTALRTPPNDSKNILNLLLILECPGLVDFVCNDEYLATIAGRQNWVFDFTKRHVAPEVPNDEPKEPHFETRRFSL